jgi:thioredoxin-related protein
LIFVVENIYKTTQYEKFAEQFNHAFYDTTFVKKRIKTYSLKEIEQLQKKKPKKVLINIYSGFCNSCKVQNKTTLTDTAIANYLNKYFYVMNFDAESNDTLIYKNEKCFKTTTNGYPLNTFAFKVSNNRLQFPTIAVLDEKLNHLDALNLFLSPENLAPILRFYAEDELARIFKINGKRKKINLPFIQNTYY